jgi:hypothetical protein
MVSFPRSEYKIDKIGDQLKNLLYERTAVWLSLRNRRRREAEAIGLRHP